MSDEANASIKPYGPALADAAARGDYEEMTAHASAAKRALAGEKPSGSGPQYHPVAEHEAGPVRKALEELERKIASLKPPHEKS
jgi:hypothetical protein